jgi:Txe/YoeB family toxin of Txe-Axe toxin-antitoxin module
MIYNKFLLVYQQSAISYQRLVYKVTDRRVYFLQARYHYQKEN